MLDQARLQSFELKPVARSFPSEMTQLREAVDRLPEEALIASDIREDEHGARGGAAARDEHLIGAEGVKLPLAAHDRDQPSHR